MTKHSAKPGSFVRGFHVPKGGELPLMGYMEDTFAFYLVQQIHDCAELLYGALSSGI